MVSDLKDAYGTSIGSYLKAFGGYDTSLVRMKMLMLKASN
jgi:hypothetical protein